jgi:hypothetical protein
MDTRQPGDDRAVESRLEAGPPELWQEVWQCVDSLLPADLVATPGGGQLIEEHADGTQVFQAPHVVYSAKIERIVGLLYQLDVVIPFDWAAWGGWTRYPGGRGLEAAPVADAARLLTAIIRHDRFCDGAIAAALADGSFGAALARLRTWKQEASPPS